MTARLGHCGLDATNTKLYMKPCKMKAPNCALFYVVHIACYFFPSTDRCLGRMGPPLGPILRVRWAPPGPILPVRWGPFCENGPPGGPYFTGEMGPPLCMSLNNYDVKLQCYMYCWVGPP